MSAGVRVLELDAELAAQVPEEDRERARRALVVPQLTVDDGPFELELEVAALPAGTSALLVAEGTVLDETRLAGRELAELVLPGEIVLPWEPRATGLPTARELTALGPVRFAVLDARFLQACALWPQLMTVVHRRLNDQEHRVATRGLICQLPRVEQRVMAVLWHLADRAGRVGPDGVVVPIAMTHAQLGRMIGAQRPTVSLAVKRLVDADTLGRRPDGSWVLPLDSCTALEDLHAPVVSG